MERVRRNIKVFRKKRDLTQKELAEKSGLHRVTIAKIESGEESLTLNKLVKIAKGLEVEIEMLFVLLGEYEAMKRDQIEVIHLRRENKDLKAKIEAVKMIANSIIEI